jgi:hypothetical protein
MEENKNTEPEQPIENIPATNEQQLNTPSTDEPILPAAETSEIINHTSDIKDMEVHHHAHHEGKKNWKSYFWEFLMLFLAVFCGFLAEYKLEHTIEHQRAKEYAQSLYKDLQNDTADINKAAWCENMVTNTIDTLVDFISSPGYLQKGGELYYYMRVSCMAYNVDWHKATLNQLLNSGNLRYFSNTQLVNLISNYNTLANITTNNDERIKRLRERAFEYRDHIVIAKYQQFLSSLSLEDIFNGKRNTVIDSLKNINLPIQNNTVDMVNALTNTVMDTKVYRLIAKKRDYPKAVEMATEIMELLKKEYHLE